MTSIATRSAIIHWRSMLGNPEPVTPDLAFVVDGRVVTWGEVHENRRKRQAERLRRIREAYWPDRAYRLTVAYFDMPLMGGWQAMINDLHGRHSLHSAWIDRDRRYLVSQLMALFPLILPFGGESEQWDRWKPTFAQQFKRRTQDGEPVGVAYLWWDGRTAPRIARARPQGH